MTDELVLYAKKYFKKGKQLGIGYGVDIVTELGTSNKLDNLCLEGIADIFGGLNGQVFKNLNNDSEEIMTYRDGATVLKTGLSLEELTKLAELLSMNRNQPIFRRGKGY